ncbi:MULTISPECIES: hypothetical protein [Saccharopolyspora]|uniref:Uncharacterized protein n=2 Tax=Saccharopolyspora TaxID=1835 RepID=A0A4R5C3U0_9PSEU|nr:MULTISPECIES: hypothetical protein [Saccharopolyspora]MBQ0922647.1 hypothetical protein [Saccharopolyspora endophytica]TDD92733.1 hypothetical protein E1202_01755 [Saccharopolyspora karakumensis]
MANADGVTGTVREIDATMLELTKTVTSFGVPKGLGGPLNGLKRAVGDLVAHLEMSQRRS